ncbi:hypothetical protein P7K49_035630 [Saguinus oedipus]|uniref:Uncharacterized protein n=1 Tax=Saguinus oedipus TaxID=9490 RepID=A0ABQ9TNT4_SAGOE|nr:hypothetical protein P7K49_035630 [Saguinus oedipus]
MSGRGGCHAQWAGCKSVHYSLVFLLDTSPTSVGKEDFEKVRRWVANLVGTLEVGPDAWGSCAPATGPLGASAPGWRLRRPPRASPTTGAAPTRAMRCATSQPAASLGAGRHPGDHAYKQVANDGRRQNLVLDATASARHASICILGKVLKEELEGIASETKYTHVLPVSDFNATNKIPGKRRRGLCENVLVPVQTPRGTKAACGSRQSSIRWTFAGLREERAVGAGAANELGPLLRSPEATLCSGLPGFREVPLYFWHETTASLSHSAFHRSPLSSGTFRFSFPA